MARINLVVGDTDCHYVEGLVGFLGENYGSELQISYFTESIYLYGYLNSKDVKVDILLLCPELVADTFDFSSVKLAMLLSDGRLESEYPGLEIVSKYQLGDKLVSDVLNAYAEKYPNERHINKGERQSKAVAVFSPLGGVGKSTVAVALAAKLAGKGSKVLFLNLEGIQTTPVYFECSNDKTLSDLLYFARDKSKALPVKLEGVRQVDTYTGIHYISPPESASDLLETKPEELADLLCQIKGMGKYGAIVVDMSSSLDSKNLAVLGCCDEILLLADRNHGSRIRMQAFFRELKIHDDKFQSKLMDRCVLVVNKCTISASAGTFNEYSSLEGRHIDFTLPKTQTLVYRRDNRYAINLNNDFGEAISALADRVWEV